MRNMSMKGKIQTVHKSAPIRFGASPCMSLPRFIDAKINNGSWVANGTPWRPKGLKSELVNAKNGDTSNLRKDKRRGY